MEKRIKSFNGTVCKSLATEVMEVLNKHFGDRGIEFVKRNGTFSDLSFEFKMKVNVVGGDGKVKVDNSVHAACDYKAKSLGYTWVGEHVIGTVWDSNGEVYEIIGYESKRRAYPLTLRRGSDGNIVQGGMVLLSKHQIVESKANGSKPSKPSKRDFTFWFTADMNKISDAECKLVDEVNDYFKATFPAEEVDDLTNIIDKLVEVGAAKRYAKRAYYLLMENGDIETTNDELYAAYDKIVNKEELSKDI